MEWLIDWYHSASEWLNPQTIITTGGLALLCLIVFVETGLLMGFFLPGDNLLLFAGVLCAQTGYAPLWAVLLFVTLAAIAGDQVGFAIGSRGGKRVFLTEKSWLLKPEYVVMTRAFYRKYGGATLIIGRFLPIVRTFAPVMAGVVNMHYRRFVLYNLIGAVLWVFSLVLLGYMLGAVFGEVIKTYEKYIIIALIILTTIPIGRMLIRTFQSKGKRDSERAQRRAERRAASADARAASSAKIASVVK
jgi:membrane-associated protein